MRILFDSKLSQFKSPFGTLSPAQVCTLRVRIPCSCRTTGCELILQNDQGEEDRRVPLALEDSDELYGTWVCRFSLPAPGLFFYYFFITTEEGAFPLYKQGDDTNMNTGDVWQLSCVTTALPAPACLQGAVMYQIFPDRFARAGTCDTRGKLEPWWLHENTDDMPVYLPNERGEVLNNDFFGGNLRGILEKLPYLQELGAEILYLNPIFFAFSTHRYDTCDYRRVDPLLGTEEDFAALCAEAHARGMKIVLDGVFSHVGSRSPYFQSAVSDPDSPYRPWFQFQHWPDRYTSWWGITTLPCVNKLEPGYLDFIIDGEDSVAVHWLRLGADGYRLDVADELPDAFILRLKRRIREVNPEAILIGEVWEDASNKIAYDVRRRYFTDRELDSVMNYPWQKAILRYVRGEDDGAELGARVMTLAENYPPDVLNACMTILSTHDTPRALTALIDPTDADRAELARRHLSPEDRTRALRLLRAAAFLQFTLPGAPCIYYGDEAGMEGYRDPFNRRFYPWGREDEHLVRFYRSLAALKKSSPALRRGAVTVMEAGKGRVLLIRSSREQTVFACCNRSPEPWSLPVSGKLLLGGGLDECLSGSVTLGPCGFCAIEK
jgi:cyclomaltodextrinase